MGSCEVLLTINEVSEGTAIARYVLLGYTEVATRGSLPSQSQSNERTWIAFVWQYISFSAINYWVVLMVFAMISFAGIYIAL